MSTASARGYFHAFGAMRAFLLPLLLAPVVLNGQDLVLRVQADASLVEVRGVSTDSLAPAPVFHATWRFLTNTADPAFGFAPTDRDAAGQLHLDRLVEAGIGAFLDQHVRFTRTGVSADLPPALIADRIEAMARTAAVAFQAADLFPGLGSPTRDQLGRLLQLDWSQATLPIDAGGDGDRYLAIYRFVRMQRDELERQLRADLLDLSSVIVLGGRADDPRTSVQVPSVCGTVFDQENFLCALDLTLAADGAGAFEPALELTAAREAGPAGTPEVAAEQPRIRKRDRWLKAELDAIHDRIDRMDQRRELWTLRDRMDDIEGRLDDMQGQVDDLREEDTAAPRTDNPLANLSTLTGEELTVRFPRNGADLGPEQRIMLNEVFEQLARSPKDRVLITGYTDRSGDPALNLTLSEQRARAVRDYLLARGIAAERLMVNYYGDSRSLGRDPSERRVEIEWLTE
ncbi:MAG: OmpA family protein [Flavobacteriales bacterium]|nr:OmpA family protein [Flavobacteriales bacterium]MBK7942248.1 OmpA family protein [Flavobacteriales bacterium]MBK8949020.1 OmpA family protein [Flavobacteriales bacterium]MBK9701835.1 OmpA family protein [Flavobacteriales bacterium]